MGVQRYRPFKRIHKRIHVWYFLTIILLLVDEYTKEGYLFKVSDVLIPLTHENLIVMVTVLYLLLILAQKR